MDVQSATIAATGTDADTGYSSFQLGSFRFSRDEYFAHVEWPMGSHIIEIDRFLRAMVRDIGWGFFYGWIFFDEIFVHRDLRFTWDNAEQGTDALEQANDDNVI